MKEYTKKVLQYWKLCIDNSIFGPNVDFKPRPLGFYRARKDACVVGKVVNLKKKAGNLMTFRLQYCEKEYIMVYKPICNKDFYERLCEGDVVTCIGKIEKYKEQDQIKRGNIELLRHFVDFEEISEGYEVIFRHLSLKEGIKRPNIEGIECLVAPCYYEKGQKKIFPIWMPLTFFKDKPPLPTKYAFPIIPRDLLAPYEEDAEFILGDFNTYQEKIIEWKDSYNYKYNTWQDIECYYYDVLDFFKIFENDFSRNGWSFCKGSFLIMPSEGASNPSTQIKKLYEELIKDNPEVKLLQDLTIGCSNRYQVNKDGSNELAGLFYSEYKNDNEIVSRPLTESQQRAVSQYINSMDSVLAITGPAGTGKTTLVKTLVASRMVEATKNECDPYVAVISSNSNEAVSNVIDELYCNDIRWLPSPDEGKHIGLALFVPSNKKDEKSIQHYFLKPSDKIKSSFSDFFEDKNYIRVAKNAFIEKAANRFIIEKVKVDSLDQAICAILKKVKQSTNANERFMWSVRYWEGRWLKEMGDINISDLPLEKQLKIRAMLTPCFASTFYTIPSFFFQREVGYLLNFADDLIVDEAGQALPYLGASPFAFAKRAIVMGDVQQIAPIVENNESVDSLLRTDNDLNDLDVSLQGVTGNLMLAAQRASQVRFSDEEVLKVENRKEKGPDICFEASKYGGLPLRDHFRCYNEIVEFCNQLCYRYIEPKRGSILKPNDNEERRLPDNIPPIGIMSVSGFSTRRNRSRCNINEVLAIRNWLEVHRKEISEKYKKPLSECVAIVTPYRAQKDMLIEALRGSEETALFTLENLYETKDHKMTIGTVHALQGQQCPIVLFSLVIDHKDLGKNSKDSDFIDDHMINVAVSRAQDCFLAFADPQVIKVIDSTHPIGRLRDYLYGNEKGIKGLLQQDKYRHFLVPGSYSTKECSGPIRIFISYRHDNLIYAERFYRVLLKVADEESKGEDKESIKTAIFFDYEMIHAGDRFDQKIEDALKECRTFILLYNKKSDERCYNKNDYVRKEIEIILKRCKEDNSIKFAPIIDSDCSRTDDFFGWMDEEMRSLALTYTQRIVTGDMENDIRKLFGIKSLERTSLERTGKKWTDKECELLTEKYHGFLQGEISLSDIAKVLSRKPTAITSKINSLGLVEQHPYDEDFNEKDRQLMQRIKSEHLEGEIDVFINLSGRRLLKMEYTKEKNENLRLRIRELFNN